jgi:hypothetical protein
VPTDKLDIKKLREADEKALEELARALLPKLERMLVSSYPETAATPEDVSDILEDVLIDVLRNRERISGRTSVQPAFLQLRQATTCSTAGRGEKKWTAQTGADDHGPLGHQLLTSKLPSSTRTS